MKTILTLTVNPSIDINTGIVSIVPERKLRCDPPTFEPGGGGINVSRAIARLGGNSTAFYFAGGATGQLLGELIARENIDHRPVGTAARTRENLNVVEHSTQQQFRFTLPGNPVEEETWAACLSQLEQVEPFPDFLVVSGSGAPGTPSGFYSAIAELVRNKDARLVADSSGSDLRNLLTAGVYLVKPNLNELRAFSGRELHEEADMLEEAGRIIRNAMARVVVISIGAAGAVYVTESEHGRVRAPTVPIRSKVGAGDSTVAGIVLTLAGGMNIRDAVTFGVASGAAAVMTPGTELCRKEDAERLYAVLKEGGT